MTTAVGVPDAGAAMNRLTSEFRRRDIRATSRAGYVRLGAHYYNSDEEMQQIVEAINVAAEA